MRESLVTASDVHDLIVASQASKETLGEGDVLSLLDVLVHNGTVDTLPATALSPDHPVSNTTPRPNPMSPYPSDRTLTRPPRELTLHVLNSWMHSRTRLHGRTCARACMDAHAHECVR